MNQDILKGNWRQLKGEIKSKWGELTDNELTEIEGDSEKLKGKLQEKYGWSKERADREVNDWMKAKA